MSKLSDIYTDFFRIDLDAPGGYARVADVVARQEDDISLHRAFKLMRHELDGQKAEERFENELKILVEITEDKNAPSAITRIYDSGFVEAKLSESLQTLRHQHTKLVTTTDFEIVSTGINVQRFLDTKTDLMAKEPKRWLPYLVVDLAPYGDSLLRQIKAQFLGKVTNLYGLPPNTIVEMGIQILYVMEYLHKKLRYAYLDWKPEHIYWNEESQRLKLIDWNVTTRLDGSIKEKQIIREDVRMFCGAALYCSLALTDPEELKKPIGTTLTIPTDKTPTIIPRYWTDKPNFYQRDSILDDEIKQLVQKALDPSQGFNSPQELKKALVQYAQRHDPKGDRTAAPYDAIQHFRRARSYIAASDFEYAIIWLELAIETAKASGETYSDAEQLLKNVRDLLKLDKFKQEVKPVLEKEQWKEALNLYAKAVALDSTNAPLKKEFNGLQDLLDVESRLRRKSIFRIFMSPDQLQVILEAALDVVGSGNPLWNFVKQQLDDIKLIQIRLRQIKVTLISGMAVLLVGILIFSFLYVQKKYLATTRVATATTAATNTSIYVQSETPRITSGSLSAIATVPAAFTETPTNTLEPSVTPTPVIVVLKRYTYPIAPLEEPTGNYMDILLPAQQPLTVIEKIEFRGRFWYKCSWKIKGVEYEGWFLEDYIQFEPTPTPTP